MPDALLVWAEIPGFPGYEASRNGDIRSWRINGKATGKAEMPRLLKQGERKGYKRVVLRRSCGEPLTTLFVHRAVLAAFRGPCPKGLEARHINGNSLDNRLSNLEWSTKAQNEVDKIAHGTAYIGSRGMRRKLNGRTVRVIRERFRAGESLADLGRDYGVSWQTIQAAVTGRTWKHVS